MAGRWGGRAAAIAALSLVGAACGGQRGVIPGRPTAQAAHDASPAPTGEAATDAGLSADDASLVLADAGPVGAPDAGAVAGDAGPGRGDAGLLAPPLVLADGCDTQLDGRASVAIAGTLAGQGPYHPCFTVGGQKLTPLALSRDATRVAALDLLGQAVVLDTATLQIRARFARRRGPYMTLALSPAGTALAATSQADGELDLFDVEAGTLLQAIDLGPPYSQPMMGLAFSPAGDRVAVTIGPAVAVVDVGTGAIQRYADGTRDYADQVLFVDGGRQLATARYLYDLVGSGSPGVTLLDLASGTLKTLLDVHDIYGWMNLAASADGSTLFAFRGSELHAWDVSTGDTKPVASGVPIRQVLDVDASGSLVATVDDYQASSTHLQVRRITDGALLRDLRLDPALIPALWSLDHDRLVVTASVPGGSGATRLGVLDTAGRTIARACSDGVGYQYEFASAAPRLLARTGAGLRVYDAGSGAPVGPLLGSGESIDGIGFSPDGGWVAWSSFIVPSVGAQVTVANATTGEERLIGDPTVTYFAVAPSSGGQLVAVRDTQTGLVTVFDVASQAVWGQVDGRAAEGALLGFSADGNALIFENDGNVQAIDWRTGSAVPPPPTDISALPAAAQAFMHQNFGCVSGWNPFANFSADGSLVAVGSNCGREFASGTISDTDLYDVASGTLIQAIPNPSTSPPGVSSDGATLAFGSTLWCR